MASPALFGEKERSAATGMRLRADRFPAWSLDIHRARHAGGADAGYAGFERVAQRAIDEHEAGASLPSKLPLAASCS